MADVSAYWVGDVVVARSVLREPGVPLIDLLGQRAAASVDNMFGPSPVDGWRVIDGALPVDLVVDVAPVIIAAPWEHPGANGWMVVSVVRHAGRWQAMHIMDRRRLLSYVSPSERWPSAIELFGQIWRLRELRPAGGAASLPTTSVGLTFTPWRDGIGVGTYNGSQRTGDAASCDTEDGTLRFGNWSNNLCGPTTALYGQQRSLFLAILDGDVAWALQQSASEDHLELTKERRSAHCASEPRRRDPPSARSSSDSARLSTLSRPGWINSCQPH
jgi:hypothetical protein